MRKTKYNFILEVFFKLNFESTFQTTGAFVLNSVCFYLMFLDKKNFISILQNWFLLVHTFSRKMNSKIIPDAY